MKKKYYIYVLLLLLLLLFLGYFIYNIHNKKKISNTNEVIDINDGEKEYQNKAPTSDEKAIKNIDVKLEKSKSGQYVAFITNNNSFVIPDLNLKINYYKNGKLVDTYSDGHDAILPGYTVVSDFESYEDYDDVQYDVSVDMDYGTSYTNHSNNIKVDYNINASGDALITITNNDDELVEEIEVIAIFYDETGNLLGTSYAKDIYNVASKKTETIKLELKDYKRRNDVKTVKIYLNQAHTF